MKKRQYYSININGLKIKNIEPLCFEHIILKKNVAFYQAGIFGRLITVEDNDPTNTLEDAETSLTNVPRDYADLEYLKKIGPVPYIDESTMTLIPESEVKVKNKKKKRKLYNHKTKKDV